MGNEEDKEKYRVFGKKLCFIQRLMTSYHSSWLRENHEYVHIKKDILKEMKDIIKQEEK